MKYLRAAIWWAVCVASLLAVPAAAQQNPFKVRTAKSKPVHVTTQLTGDMTGTGEYAADGDKFMHRSTQTGRFFGKTSTEESWTLTTAGYAYSADLKAKTGSKIPNPLPIMARAYDDLDKPAKQRLHDNMQAMADVLSQALGASSLAGLSQPTTTKTYAGAECQETEFAGWSVCSMKKAPSVALHVKGTLLCTDYEETATSVESSVPSAAFELPAGVQFREPSAAQSSDSAAHALVQYWSSQELSDSLAKAKREMQQQQADAPPEHQTAAADTLSTEQKRQACDALKNTDLGKMMADATSSLFKEAAHEAVQEKKTEEREKAKGKIKGLFKKPHF